MLHGIKCRNCDGRRDVQAYITAYDIAVKHGYTGTEKEWVETLQSVYTARVTGESGYEWSGNETFDELLAQANERELHLLSPEGMVAFCHGISDTQLIFQTLPYDDPDIGSVYKQYEITSANVRTFQLHDAVSPGQGSITKNMLSNQVQTSLGKADTAYQKPAGGITGSDLTSEIARNINLAPIIGVVIKRTGTTYDVDWDNTDLNGYNSIPEAINDAADVRAIITDGNTFAEHPFCYAPDPNIIVFAGPEYDTFGEGTATIVYYIVDATQPHVTRVVKTLS